MEPQMEARLWEYIDGLAPAPEQRAIEALIAADKAWKDKYEELLELHRMLPTAELDAPSLRFTKNVMEEISKLSVQPAARQYINRHVIRGLAAFFITTLLLTLGYSLLQADWSEAKVSKPLFSLDYSKLLSPSLANGLLGLQVVLGLFLLDRYLNYRKMQHRKGASA